MTNPCDHQTYANLSGMRKLRPNVFAALTFDPYSWVTLVLVPLVTLLLGLNGDSLTRINILSTESIHPLAPTVRSTPTPDLTITATKTASPSPSSTATLTPTFLATETVLASIVPSPTPPQPPSTCPCSSYLPLIWGAFLPEVILEIEPNNTFSQAQFIPLLPASVYGIHDATANTGDVYKTERTAGEIVYITLTTENQAGLQLLAYSGENPNEIVRDFETPFELTFLAIATDTYFLYVFTPGSINNTGSYTLTASLSKIP